MGKRDLQPATVQDFFYWMNERHRIYNRRFNLKSGKPWTDDSIFQTYKFTNVFRQLDTGTIALNKMLGRWHKNRTPLADLDIEDAVNILFNVVWYRLFNLADHAEDIGWTHAKDFEYIRQVLVRKRELGKKVFTSAHMTTGTGEVIQQHGKIYGHLTGPRGIAEEFGEDFIAFIYHNQSLEAVTKKLCEIQMVGQFIAYEIVCDLRFTPLLSGAKDKLSWANLGPGAKRGLQRLGKEPSSESIVKLYNMAIDFGLIGGHIAKHFLQQDGVCPFELREIEHSLCEFDKYQRVKTGAGRPRQKYQGV